MDQIIDQRDTAGAVVTDGLGRNVKQTIQVRDEPGIARHVAELDEVIALKVQEVRLVKRQQTLAATVAAHLKAGIQERIARIQAIKAKVKANLAARATMLKDLHAERKNKHPRQGPHRPVDASHPGHRGGERGAGGGDHDAR